MKKIIALLLLTLSTFTYAEKPMIAYDYPIVKIVDGDTVIFEAVFLPTPLKKELSLRVYGVDTPEKGARAKCAKEDQMGQAATQFTANAIRSAKIKHIAIMEWDKFGGRVLGDVMLDGQSLREMLIKNKLARPYFGDAKKSWCD